MTDEMMTKPGQAFKCPKCGTTTWGNLKHCANCGQALNIVCPECGGSWRYIYARDYKCCPNCGAKMQQEKLSK